MKRFGIGLAFALLGYVALAVLGYGLILKLTTNVHDPELEAAMTAAFLAGPVGAVIGFTVGFIRGDR
jgi:hypothetical protein